MARLERAASTSQMWRPTNWATPGYLVVMIIARKSCDSKSFPVCGHLCGQARFLPRFCQMRKSRKRLCCKGFRALAVPIVDRQGNAPKAGALPTALHPVIQFFIRLGVFSQTYTYTRTCIRGEYGLGIILTHIILPIYTVKSSGFRCAPLFLCRITIHLGQVNKKDEG